VNICIFLSDDTENIKSKTKLFHAAVWPSVFDILLSHLTVMLFFKIYLWTSQTQSVQLSI
jgi:hypothetical protein